MPVTVELLDQNGNLRFVNGTPLRQTVSPHIMGTVLQSPLYNPSVYTSGIAQFNDQMQCAEFWDQIHGGKEGDGWNNNWHKLLMASVKTTRVMRIPYGSYSFALNADGSC